MQTPTDKSNQYDFICLVTHLFIHPTHHFLPLTSSFMMFKFSFHTFLSVTVSLCQILSFSPLDFLTYMQTFQLSHIWLPTHTLTHPYRILTQSSNPTLSSFFCNKFLGKLLQIVTVCSYLFHMGIFRLVISWLVGLDRPESHKICVRWCYFQLPQHQSMWVNYNKNN